MTSGLDSTSGSACGGACSSFSYRARATAMRPFASVSREFSSARACSLMSCEPSLSARIAFSLPYSCRRTSRSAISDCRRATSLVRNSLACSVVVLRASSWNCW